VSPQPSDRATSPESRSAPRHLWRVLFSVGLAVGVATYVVALGLANPDFTSDFDQVWAGARALWQGKDPYVVVGPGREFGWHWPLYYPLPALVAVAPLGLLPLLAARAVFAGLSAALFAWAITRDGWFRVPTLLTVSFMVTVELGQWSALIAAAFFMPALGSIAFAKPNFGIALAASSHERGSLAWIIGGTVALLVVSQVLEPGWHESWLANLREAPHFKSHIQRPFGFLMLLAALKWRRPEARWMLALAVIPQAPSFYDQLLLTAVCLTRQESLILAASTVLLFFYVGYHTPQPDYLAWGRLVGNGTLWICYLPMLGLLLMRPNEGRVPPIVDRLLNRLRPRRG
jgi:hypothetical protein